MITKKAAFAAGVVDFDALARFNRNPYGDRRRALAKVEFWCDGGPFANQGIWLSVPYFADDYQHAVATLPFRSGDFVGRYVGMSNCTARWEAA